MLALPALPLVLKPNLHRARRHAELLGEVHALVARGEEGLAKDLVEAVDLVGGGALALGLDHALLVAAMAAVRCWWRCWLEVVHGGTGAGTGGGNGRRGRRGCRRGRGCR